MMNNILWYRLLYFWSYKKIPIGSGLTIPFLFGAEKTFGGREECFNLIMLIEEFIEFDLERFNLTFRKCGNIGTLVCSLEELTDIEKRFSRKFGNLYIFSDRLKNIHTTELLIKYLSSQFSKFIDFEYYSIDSGKWSKFSTMEVEMIKSVKAGKL